MKSIFGTFEGDDARIYKYFCYKKGNKDVVDYEIEFSDCEAKGSVDVRMYILGNEFTKVKHRAKMSYCTCSVKLPKEVMVKIAIGNSYLLNWIEAA